METLHQGERLVIQGFGSFKVNEYKSRLAKKPLTGEIFQLPVRRKPCFHAGKELRERVNEEFELGKEDALISQIRTSEPSIAYQMDRDNSQFQ